MLKADRLRVVVSQAVPNCGTQESQPRAGQPQKCRSAAASILAPPGCGESRPSTLEALAVPSPCPGASAPGASDQRPEAWEI